MSTVLEWVKTNVFIVVFIVLMIAAVIALPILSGGMNANVRQSVDARAQIFSKLTLLEKMEIVPGHIGAPNDQTFRRYEEFSKVMADDAEQVQKAAIEHNRKGRGVLLPGLFPEPPQNKSDVMPRLFHEALTDAYGNLLAEIKAGMPPSLETMRQDLLLTKAQFITQDLKKDSGDTLEPDELKRLTEKLTNVRMSVYAGAAEKIGLYVSQDQLGVPGFDHTRPPSLGEMFNWQWQYWIVQDVLRSLHTVNQADPFVSRAPVKQVVSLLVLDLPAPADATGSNGGGGSSGSPRLAPPMGGGFGAGAGGFGEGSSGAPSAPPAGGGDAAPAAPSVGGPPNPKVPVPSNFAASITGRTTNPLYDVVNVELQLVVETSRLPQVLDALARYNFMTVTALHLKGADPFEATQGGFFYGSAPVSSVTMTLETVWLRAWTQEFMPNATKQALGMPVQPPPGANPPTT